MTGLLQQKSEIEKLKSEYKTQAEKKFSPSKKKLPVPEETFVLEESTF